MHIGQCTYKNQTRECAFSISKLKITHKAYLWFSIKFVVGVNDASIVQTDQMYEIELRITHREKQSVCACVRRRNETKKNLIENGLCIQYWIGSMPNWTTITTMTTMDIAVCRRCY